MEPKQPVWKRLYVQVLVAIAIGIVMGFLWPTAGAKMKPLGDAFIALVKMMIAPIIFCTIVHGIGSMSDMKRVGRIGLKALIYFEVVSTVALVLGLFAAHAFKPGLGLDMSAMSTNAGAVSQYVERAAQSDTGMVAHLMAIIPVSFFDALARGELLQVLLVSIFTGIALTQMGELGNQISHGIDKISKVFFQVVGIIVYFAPIGAFGAIAYTVGAFGVKSLINLGYLIVCFYATAIIFILLVMGPLARMAGFSIVKFISYIREELLIVFGTSSSETVLPNMMRKLKKLGVSESVVGLVIPTGYSFNLDGTNIYMTLSILFLAQATGTDLTWGQEATIIAISMLTSKGASGVTGAGFVVLAATLTIVPNIPIESLGVLLGIDRFMSLGRSLTNLIGNGVATIIVGRWENELDQDQLTAELNRKGPVSA